MNTHWVLMGLFAEVLCLQERLKKPQRILKDAQLLTDMASSSESETHQSACIYHVVHTTLTCFRNCHQYSHAFCNMLLS